ncbi:MAG: hypothetical protein KME42_14105 [Tildeniella nuda ZEHNDER 1965/U140]|jgi:hypothetical protein|nr:hypothetical protein [Tildeniella nuda ZEHNDER 1965/U140]
MGEFKAVAKRYGSFEIHEYSSMDEAISDIEGGNDLGEHYGIGIYNEQSNSVWLPETTAVQIDHDGHSGVIKKALNLPQALEFDSISKFGEAG